MVKKICIQVFLMMAFFVTCEAQEPVTEIKTQLSFSEMKIYPNPVKEGEPVNIKVSNFISTNLLVVVCDIFGRELYSKIAVYEKAGILFSFDNQNRLPAGIYVIIASANDQVFRQRLIVQ